MSSSTGHPGSKRELSETRAQQLHLRIRMGRPGVSAFMKAPLASPILTKANSTPSYKDNTRTESSAAIVLRTMSRPRNQTTQSDIANPSSIPATDSYLCSVCRDVFYCSKPPKAKVLMHRVIDIIDGVNEGCKFCQMVWQEIDKKRHQTFLRAAKKPGSLAYAKKCELICTSGWLSLTWQFFKHDHDGIMVFLNMNLNSDTRKLANNSHTMGKAP